MPAAPSESFVAALTEEETCPLCLDGYAPVDEAVCAICEAPACSGCVEQLDTDDAQDDAQTRCFACRPAIVPPVLPPQAVAARAAPAARDAVLPPALPLELLAQPQAARGAQPPPLPRRRRAAQPPPPLAWSAYDEDGELVEGGMVVFPAWRKRPLLALARAADAMHLVEVSALLVGWAHTGGRRFALTERVSRVSREWSVTLRERGAGLRRYGLQLRKRGADLRRYGTRLRARGADLRRLGLRVSLPLWTGLRVRSVALSHVISVRAMVMVARTVALSRRMPLAARAAWSQLPSATGLSAATARLVALPSASWPPLRLSCEQLGRCGRSVGRACGVCLRAARRPFDSLSTRLMARSKHAN
jgi:hypothetical protein